MKSQVENPSANKQSEEKRDVRSEMKAVFVAFIFLAAFMVLTAAFIRSCV